MKILKIDKMANNIQELKDRLEVYKEDMRHIETKIEICNDYLRQEFVTKLNGLISQTPTGDLRNDLTDLNILFNLITQ